jgi:hypothetical protein
MNTKLVEALTQTIQSLSKEERTLLEKNLFFNTAEPSTLDLTNLTQTGGSLDFLHHEPDLYTLEDGDPV